MIRKFQHCCHPCHAPAWALCVLAALSSLVVTAREQGPIVPQQGLLVLANGSIMAGSIALDGDYYHVQLEKGKLQIRVDQVDFFCHTMVEAYARRQARRLGQSPTANSHLEMAQWCLQHELFEFATAELSAARILEPQHQLLPMLERRLAQIKELSARESIPAEAGAPIPDHQVQLAVAKDEPESTNFGEIPLWARTEFIKRIQPMMIHSCATGGCHSSNSPQQMRVERSALDGVGNPDLIHRNLAAVIAQVNLEDTEASRLLTFGATAHGIPGAKQSRPLTPHQLEIVRAWVTQLALRETPVEETESQPRVAQIVVGMNSSAQQKFIAEEKATAEKADPFDPTAFNAEAAPLAAANSDSAATKASNLTDPESQQIPPAESQE